MMDDNTLDYLIIAAIAATIGGIARLLWVWEGETWLAWTAKRIMASLASGLLAFGLFYEPLAAEHPVLLITTALAAGVLDGDILVVFARRVLGLKWGEGDNAPK